jgi:hypothetical protein
LVDTVEHAETVEKELNAFIERRSRKYPDADEEHTSCGGSRSGATTPAGAKR